MRLWRSMIGKGLIQRRTQMVRATALIALGLTMVPADVAAAYFTAFTGSYALPGSLATGTVVARRSYTPTQLCGETKCRLHQFKLITMGAVDVGLPATTVSTRLTGLAMRVIVNGKPQTLIDKWKDQPVIFSTPVEVQLVKDPYVEIKSSTAKELVHSWFFTKTMTDNTEIINYFSLGDSTLTRIEGTCSVPTQTVQLPPTIVRNVGGLGSTFGTREFQIKINSCPKGYNRVGYTLEPMGGVADAPGVLPLGTDSTATGVKIRLTDRDGVAAKFGTSIKVDDYSKTTGGSYAIPMQASYLQTEAAVTPGSVKGAISVRLDYQ
ncbi:fimbrial protein [Ralstonia chuxiongensis]|uniref:Fimbrial protein n=1 Tax=Ralstonia chuxiongensis TaxID=2957504 RepID=A0AA41WSC8_9RALS|nr:fimbrial protein [Ralstonia chuxiongensis]MCP1174116.1 fimbrial protein [Ralstonia chuxiongensis]